MAHPSTDASADSPPRRVETGAGARFLTTHWSAVQMAARNDTPRAEAALEELCRRYWHPLYHYVRRSGHGPEDARDLTQGFFARFLQRGALAKADPSRGRFRSFLLASMKNFLADAWDKQRALKRHPAGLSGTEWTVDDEEQRLAAEPAAGLTPEEAFDRRWAMALLEQVYRRLADEFGRQGKSDQFAALRVALAGERGAVPYAVIARQLALSEGAVKVAVHRLRRRYRDVLRETIADTVLDAAEVEEELRYLLQVLSR